MGVQACRLPGLEPLKPLQRCKILLLRPTPQAQATPRPHQWLFMGVQALRLLGLKRLKPLQRCKILLLRPTPQAQATPRPHQWLLMGVQACRLPGLKPLKLYNAAKYAKSSCYAQPRRHKLPQGQARATPRPHQWLLMGVQACRLPGLKRLKPLQRCKILLLRPTPQAQATPRPHLASYGRSSLPFARP